jgi:hypothetical protein
MANPAQDDTSTVSGTATSTTRAELSAKRANSTIPKTAA